MCHILQLHARGFRALIVSHPLHGLHHLWPSRFFCTAFKRAALRLSQPGQPCRQRVRAQRRRRRQRLLTLVTFNVAGLRGKEELCEWAVVNEFVRVGPSIVFLCETWRDGKGWFGQLHPHGSVTVQLRWYGHAGMETGGRISGGVGFLVAADTAEICMPQLWDVPRKLRPFLIVAEWFDMLVVGVYCRPGGSLADGLKSTVPPLVMALLSAGIGRLRKRRLDDACDWWRVSMCMPFVTVVWELYYLVSGNGREDPVPPVELSHADIGAAGRWLLSSS